MRYAVFLVTLAAFLCASPAFAQATVTNRVTAPYIPEGFAMELTEDCRIVSAGRPDAPDAQRRCKPGYGWRVMDAAGAAIYPKRGYISGSLDWAFAGTQAVVLRSGDELTLVRLPSGDATDLGEGALEPLRNVEGIGFTGVIWLNDGAPDQPVKARPLLPSGELGPAIVDSDMRPVDRLRDLPCWRAGVLAAIAVEILPNAVWKEIRRQPGEGRTQCDAVMSDTLAGLGADGRWRSLDNMTLRMRGYDTFASPEEALALQ